MVEFRNSIPIQVRFNDVDLLGHVSNTVYPTYFDIGKNAYFAEVLGDGADYFTSTAIVGASTRIDYLKPIYIPDTILCQTRVVRLGHKSFTFEHRLLRRPSDEVVSTCTTVVVCFDPSTQRSIPIPDEWRACIAAYEQIPLYPEE